MAKASPKPHTFMLSTLLMLCITHTCHADVITLFSALPKTLLVTASPTPGQVLKAGEDKITVTWQANQTFPGTTFSPYRSVKLKLCYAPVSQVDRAWRKTKDELKKDKTCQFVIVHKSFDSSNSSGVMTTSLTVGKEIPTATYFVRAYAYDGEEHALGFGQTTDKNKTTNLFQIEGITGRHVSLDVAAVCFSAFSVVALGGFFFVEKRKTQ